MSDEKTNPPIGVVPPKPAEAPAIITKKETVRITLPPKPTASPTIKIPAPSAIGAASPAPAAPSLVGHAAPAMAAAPAQKSVGVQPAKSPAPAPRPAAAPIYSGIKMMDKILAVIAAVVAIGAAVCVFLLSSSGS